MDMENTRSTRVEPAPLVIRADMLDDDSEIGFQLVKAFGDLAQSKLEGVEARSQRVAGAGVGLVPLGWPAAVQHGVEVLRVPTQRGGQRLQGSRAAAPLDRWAPYSIYTGTRQPIDGPRPNSFGSATDSRPATAPRSPSRRSTTTSRRCSPTT